MILAVVCSVIVVDTQTHCALPRCVCELKQMNTQCTLLRKFIFYKFKLGHIYAEATKNLCCAKGGWAVDHYSIGRLFMKFASGFKILDDQLKLGKPERVDSLAILQTTEANQVTRTRRVSDDAGIAQFSVIHYYIHLSKSIMSWWIVLHVTKIYYY